MKIPRINFTKNLPNGLRENLRSTAKELPKYLQTLRTNLPSSVSQKFQDINNWYTRVIGLDEVRRCQDRVVSLQERLLEAQERRRGVGTRLAEIRKKSNDLQDQIHKVKRQENLQKFLDLMREETEVLKLEQETSHEFSECDREEREVFTAFTNAVRDSHEKQRAQLEYTKYFGIILSIVGSLLTFCYSTVKKRDLRKCIEDNIAKIGQMELQYMTQMLVNDPSMSEALKKSVLSLQAVQMKNPNELLNSLVKNVSEPILMEIRKQNRDFKEIKQLILTRKEDIDVNIRSRRELDELRGILQNNTVEIRDFNDIAGKIAICTGLGLVVTFILLRSIVG